jgi:hypothetical protein
VRLSRKAAAAEQATPLVVPSGDGGPAVMNPQQVYAFYFHGPAYQVVATAWREGDEAAAALAADLPDNHRPPELPLATAPRLAELCFQTAGLWQAGIDGVLALPARVDRVLWLRDPPPPPAAWWPQRGRRAKARSTARWWMRRAVSSCVWRVTTRWPCRRPLPEAVAAGPAGLFPSLKRGALVNPIKRLGILDRGETAVRMLNAVGELNQAARLAPSIATVLIHRDADARPGTPARPTTCSSCREATPPSPMPTLLACLQRSQVDTLWLGAWTPGVVPT